MISTLVSLLPYLATIGLFIALTFESLAMTSRIYFEKINLSTLTVTTTKLLLLINRFGIALCMPVIGLLIDIGKPTSQIANVFAYGFFFSGLSIILITTNPNFIIYSSNKILRIIGLTGSDETIMISGTKKVSQKGILVGGLSAAGLIIPGLAASIWQEYSTFLIQTGFLINSVAAILNVFIIDLPNSKSLMKDKMSVEIMINTRGKAISYIISSLIIWICFL